MLILMKIICIQIELGTWMVYSVHKMMDALVLRQTALTTFQLMYVFMVGRATNKKLGWMLLFIPFSEIFNLKSIWAGLNVSGFNK